MRDEFGEKPQLSLATVSMGRPAAAREFCERQRLPFVCLSDPRREAYRAYGLKRGTVVEVMGPAAVVAGVRAVARGHMQGRPVDDVYQLGGTFLIVRAGVIRYARYPTHSGDHPPPGDLTQVLSALA